MTVCSVGKKGLSWQFIGLLKVGLWFPDYPEQELHAVIWNVNKIRHGNQTIVRNSREVRGQSLPNREISQFRKGIGQKISSEEELFRRTLSKIEGFMIGGPTKENMPSLPGS